MDTDLNASPFLTVQEAAEMFRMHQITIYRLCKRGTMPFFKVGGRIKIPKDAFDRMMEKKCSAPSA